jgi:hypothetical protein
MSETHSVVITSKGRLSTIEVDGRDVSPLCRSVFLDCTAGDVTRVSLELLPDVVEFRGDDIEVEGHREVIVK